MISKTLSTIKNAVSGERTYNLVREISNFHRIQASTGYRAAAEHVKNRLEQDGLEVRIRSYPADGKTWFFTSKMFKEWNCRDAALTLVSPERRLADFKSNNMSIIQRSYPTDFHDQPLEIVMLERGSDPAAYEGLDLRGKLIFVREHFQGFVDWAVTGPRRGWLCHRFYAHHRTAFPLRSVRYLQLHLLLVETYR